MGIRVFFKNTFTAGFDSYIMLESHKFCEWLNITPWETIKTGVCMCVHWQVVVSKSIDNFLSTQTEKKYSQTNKKCGADRSLWQDAQKRARKCTNSEKRKIRSSNARASKRFNARFVSA